jgi:hypothetical protein
MKYFWNECKSLWNRSESVQIWTYKAVTASREKSNGNEILGTIYKWVKEQIVKTRQVIGCFFGGREGVIRQGVCLYFAAGLFAAEGFSKIQKEVR